MLPKRSSEKFIKKDFHFEIYEISKKRMKYFEFELQHFAKQRKLVPDRRILLVVDGVGFHRAKKLKVPDGIHLHLLPPYSPELQPVEQIWPLSHECHANRTFENIEDLEKTLIKRCMWLSKNKEIIAGRTNFNGWPH